MSHASDPAGQTAILTTNRGEFATIPDALRVFVADGPDRLAFRDGTNSVTYGELDAASNGVAHRLLELGDDRPLLMVAPLDIPTIEILFGALKAGRLAVPLDPRWPRDQWLAVAHETQGHLVVPDDATRSELPEARAERVLVASDLVAREGDDPHLDLEPDTPAFVFFTSGSTGTPKGTVLGHGLAQSALDLNDLDTDDRLALVAPLSFITGALAALAVPLSGGSGHLCDVTTTDPARIAAWLDDEQITKMALSPTIVGLLARAAVDAGRPIGSLRLVVQGGEVGTPEHFALARRAFPNAHLVNAWGMTETGGAGCLHDVDPDEVTSGEAVPVGRPFPGVHIDIIDEDGRPMPPGEPGEIRVTARRVAFGYWRQPALTAERFSVGAHGMRSVRTGDRGRLGADGTLEHLGRMDRRVKVHGQTVDLAEVEREVERLPDVRQAIVSAVPTDDGTQRVVAHVVVDMGEGIGGVTVASLRRGLATRLPPYAIPRAFFRIDHVPLTITGKVDRVLLRESAVGALPLDTEYLAPRDDKERSVAHLFAEVLAVDRVGVHDDFFELGGDSLSAIELLAALSEDLDLDLSASELLRHATVEAVAARLDHDRRGRVPTIVRVNDATGRPLFCVPGAADTPVRYRPLGRRLSSVAVYAFAYHGMDSRAVPDQTIAAIARRNITAMREIDPAGPYRVLGYSFGGAVALEMARQLLDAGDDVELLALLDPSLGRDGGSRVGKGRAFASRVHERTVDAHPGTDLRARLTRVADLGRVGRRYATRQLYLASAGLIRRRGLAQHNVFFELHGRLLRLHRSSRYDGPTVLCRSIDYYEHTEDALDAVLPPESMGGRRRDVSVACEHIDLVREPNVAEVARTLDRILATTPV
ncbi:MAG TPA: AMP-binding protein [Acidimicrobiia bacterium]